MKNIKYEEAVKQLETIVDKMENGDLDIDSMTEELKESEDAHQVV